MRTIGRIGLEAQYNARTGSAVKAEHVWFVRSMLALLTAAAVSLWDFVVPYFYFELFLPTVGRYALTEAWVASGAFFLWINVFSLIRTAGLRSETLNKWHIHDYKARMAGRGWTVEAEAGDVGTVSHISSAARSDVVFASSEVEAAKTTSRKNLRQEKWTWRQYLFQSQGAKKAFLPVFVYMLAIFLFHEFVRKRPPLTERYPDKFRCLAELGFGVVAYDFLMFWIHVLFLHQIPLKTLCSRNRLVDWWVTTTQQRNKTLVLTAWWGRGTTARSQDEDRENIESSGKKNQVWIMWRGRSKTTTRKSSEEDHNSCRGSTVVPRSVPAGTTTRSNNAVTQLVEKNKKFDQIMQIGHDHVSLGAQATICRSFQPSNPPGKVSKWHSRHHSAAAAALWPVDTVHHGLLDGFLQVAVNIAVQQKSFLFFPGSLPKHDFTRLLHNVLITFLLTESHSGLDAPFSLHRVLGKKFYGGAWNHDAHHAGGNRHLQQFFCYLDWFFKLDEQPA
ncbi:unnamed protein product [Amoebophrya sp. A120]|nr:unnamed protein product [Amoebophrya sp. A120]|eukprot:GSA120T00001600001.1